MKPKLICSEHMQKFLEPKVLADHIELAIQALLKHDFDSLAFRGMSGAVIAPTVAIALQKELLLVRKPDESAHSYHDVEGNVSSRKYIIIDDFIASGETAQAIRRAIRSFAPKAKCLGVLPVQRIDKKDLDRYDIMSKPYPLSSIPRIRPQKGT